LGNFPNTQEIGKFPEYPGIWEISEIFGEFPKCLGILEISSHLRNFQNLKNIPHSNICRYLGNIPDTQAFVKFLFLTF